MSKHIKFKAPKRNPKKIRVSFLTSSGKRVSFVAVRRPPKRVKLHFREKRKTA